MASLSKLSTVKKAEAGVEIAILHPETDKPLGVYITVYGSDSSVCKSILRRQTNNRLEKAAQRKSGKKAAVTAEQLENESLDLLAGCTKGWRTEILDAKGKKTGERPEVEIEDDEWISCTPDNARRLYEEIPYIREQVDQAIGDRSNFLPA